jgi:complex iron-sulfur molybdoenzyme family reductase subunit gamma
MRWSRKALAIIGALALVGAVAGVLGAPSASSQTLTLRAIRAPEQPSMDPDWEIWAKLPSVQVPITQQAVTYPMGGGSIAGVKLQALHYDGTLYVRAQWRDGTRDAAAASTTSFADALALMFPAESAVTIPSFCMGQVGSGVNIWQWRADSQDGGPLQVTLATRPNAYTDGYLPGFEDDPLYYPAKALGNPVTMLGDSPVQNLIAQAFGTLTLAQDQSVAGNGVWRDGEWSVVFARDFRAGDSSQAEFTSDVSTNLAVAAWNGSEGDRGGKKTVSQFVTLTLTNATFHPATSSDWGAVGIALLLGGGAVLAGIALVGFVALISLGGRQRA